MSLSWFFASCVSFPDDGDNCKYFAIFLFSYFPSWPFLRLFLFACLRFFVHSFAFILGYWKRVFSSLLLVCFLWQGHAARRRRPREHHAWVPLPAAPRICCSRVYIRHSGPGSDTSPVATPVTSSLALWPAPPLQWRLIAVGASWASFLQPSLQFLFVPLSGDLLLPVAMLPHSPPPGCRLIWKIAANICEAWQKKQRQMLKVAPALIVWICQYC